MSKFVVSQYQKQRPVIQMAPLIDIIFLTLVFFMVMSVFGQLESELSISVPKASESVNPVRSPGEIIINITKDGRVIVNQKELTKEGLQKMLKRVAALFPNQAVIIRADENAYHKYVIRVLDACAAADIWNISFSTMKEE